MNGILYLFRLLRSKKPSLHQHNWKILTKAISGWVLWSEHEFIGDLGNTIFNISFQLISCDFFILVSSGCGKESSITAQVLLFSGEEVSIVATNSYNIPDIKAESSLTKLTGGGSKGSSLLGQAGMAYRMRGENNVFPVKSKIINTDNAIIRFQLDEEQKSPLNFKLVDSRTKKQGGQRKT